MSHVSTLLIGAFTLIAVLATLYGLAWLLTTYSAVTAILIFGGLFLFLSYVIGDVVLNFKRGGIE